MQFKRLRRSFRKRFKAQQKQVGQLGSATEKSIERNVFRRFERLRPVRRFVFGWAILFLLMIGALVAQFLYLGDFYQTIRPVDGGIYTEGSVGAITNVNPIYATSDVDRSLSRLLFASLLTYDRTGKLVPDLASTYSVGDNGRTYTVKLRHGLTWHDNAPLTSTDVAFTFNTIKDPDARSPLQPSWQKTVITTPDVYTVVFTLPSALAAFPYTLTTGIIPEHLLAHVSAANLRSSDFNTSKPIGAGPFMWHGLQVTGNTPQSIEEQVALLPFAHYVAGQPKLSEFILRAYGSAANLRHDFAAGELTAIAGQDSLPAGSPKSSQTYSLLQAAGSYAFFKTTSGVLADAKVRQAMVAASNPSDIIAKLGYTTRPVTEPLLANQLAYNKTYTQKTGDLALAHQLLTDDGWQASSNGVLTKNNQPLRFTLVTTDNVESRLVSHLLQKQWQTVGAKVNLQLLAPADYSTALAGHDYDATLYGISIGTDPDVYAYWDSTQADVRSTTRLNISEWQNATADAALEAGRTRLDPALRTVKYAPFLQAWQQDAPALGLYQPRYAYFSRSPVYGLTKHAITNGIDRFDDVQNWQIRTAKVND